MAQRDRTIVPASEETTESTMVFISAVAPGDEKLRLELVRSLSPLQRSGLIRVWHDGMLRDSLKAEAEIQFHLQEAHIILLLLSPGFVDSDLCYQQMQFALEQRARKATLIPLLLRPVYSWEDLPIGKLAPLPTNGRAVTLWQTRDVAWYEIARKLRATVLSLLDQVPEENSTLSKSTHINDPHSQSLWTNAMADNIFAPLFHRQLDEEQRALMQAFAIYREAVPLSAALVVAATWLTLTDQQADQILQGLVKQNLLQIAENLDYQLPPAIADFIRLSVLANNPQGQREAHGKAAYYYQDHPQQIEKNRQKRQIKNYHTLIETIWHLGQAERQQAAYDLMCQTHLFADLHRWGQHNLLLELYMPLAAAQAWPTELARQARLANEMGEIHNALGQKHEARLYYERAVAAYRAANQTEGLVEALNNLGAVYRLLGHAQQAFHTYQEALSCCEEASAKIVWQGVTLHNLGKALYEQGQQESRNRQMKQARSFYNQALAYYKQALVWHREMKLVDEEPRTLHNMGEVYEALEQPEKAHKYYWRALKRSQARGNQRDEGMTLNNLGALYTKLGARDNFPEALECTEKAREYYEQALALFKETGDRWQEGKALRNLGRFFLTYQPLDLYERCKQCLLYFLQARAIFQTLQAHELAEIPAWIQEAISEELGKEQFEALWQKVCQEIQA